MSIKNPKKVQSLIYAPQFQVINEVMINCVSQLCALKQVMVTKPFGCPTDESKTSLELVFEGDSNSSFVTLSVKVRNLSNKVVFIKSIRGSFTGFNGTVIEDKGESLILKKFGSKAQPPSSSNNEASADIQRAMYIMQRKLPNEMKITFDVAYGIPPYKSGNSQLALIKNAASNPTRLLHTILKAHKIILASRSDYFERMFDSGMVEGRTGFVKIDSCDPALFEEILKFCYSGMAPTNLDKVAAELLPLADRFLLMDLKSLCTKALAEAITDQNVGEVLNLASHFDCPDLKKYCFVKLSGFSEKKRFQILSQYPDLGTELFEFLEKN